ncbi:hypothetical protein CBR_g49175 [Chara braunii]|uniref:Uncharacterized protein n=1 Tax=Chara braunii TaxID=69332 RepID=A0A388M471_CHABU|nr:hypothetical protein CBR_g49175 [Chara braunii]|eukprot:GBG89384.1 hypothetical protein CBR_g49175 [Chara braunii]
MNDEELNTWLRTVPMWVRAKRMLQEEEVITVASYLDGKATKWLDGIVAKAKFGQCMADWGKTLTFEEFWDMEEARWHNPQQTQIATDAMLRLDQRRYKSIRELTSTVENLIVVLGIRYDDQVLLTIFLRCLLENLRTLLASEARLEYHSFETFSKKALDLEATLGSAQPTPVDGRKKKCPQEWKKKGSRLMMVEFDGTKIEIEELTDLMDGSEYDDKEIAEGSTLAAVVKERELNGRLQANSSGSGELGRAVSAAIAGRAHLCWARGDRSKVRRKAKTKRIRHTVFQSVSTMAAMVVLLLLALLQLAVRGLAQTPPSGTVRVESFSYSGSGCPPGSAEGALSDDGVFSLVLPEFTVFTPGRKADLRKNCQVSVTVRYPAGFTFSVTTATFRGYAQFEEGVTGSLAAAYYFSSIPGTARFSRSLPPPVEGNFELSDSFATPVYAPCGRQSVTLGFNFEASVLPPSRPNKNNKGLITVTSQGNRYSLLWKKC